MPENINQRQTPCPAWMWLVLALGLILLYLVYNHATSKKALWIQEDIQTRASQNLHNHVQLKGIIASADGRDITLSGEANSEQDIAQAVQIAGQTLGARLVTNQLTVNSKAAASAPDVDDDPALSSEQKQNTQQDLPELVAKVEPMPESFAPLESEIIEQQQPDTERTEEEVQAEVTKEKLGQLDFSNITFEKNSTDLTAQAQEILGLAASALLENPTVNIRIEGHTDSSGNPELNLKLSKKRAQSVLNYFLNAGLDTSRMEADGFGDQFPIAPNDTKAGRIKNRRIEIKVKNGE